MKKSSLLMAFAFLLVLFAGCITVQEEVVEEVTEEPKEIGGDCGTDMDCFIEAAENCTEASMVRIASVETFGMITTAKNLMEIQGMENGKCVYYQKTLESSVSFSEEMLESAQAANATQEQIDAQLAQANEMAQSTVGFEVTCEFEAVELSSMLKRWKEGTASSKDLAGCEYTVPETASSPEAEEPEQEKICAPVAGEGSYVEFAITENYDYSKGGERVYGKMLPGDVVDLKEGAEIRLEGFKIEADCESCGAVPVNLRKKEAEIFVLLPGKEGQLRTFENGDKTQLCLSLACSGVDSQGECLLYSCEEPVYLHIFDVHTELSCE